MDRCYIEKIISNDYKIFVDTSSLLQDSSEAVFFKIIAPLLCLHKKKMIVPKSVYNEIYKHSRSRKIRNIDSGIKILNNFARNNLYIVESTFDEQFADNAIISLFSSIRLKYNLCLITNDNSYKKSGNLSQDILDLKDSRSVDRIKDIVVFYLNNENKNIIQFKNNSKISVNYNNHHRKISLFRLPNIVKKGEQRNHVKMLPEVNSYVFDKKGNKYRLEKQIGRAGGEGSVYITSKKGYVCKIYKTDKNTNFKQEKIRLLTKNNINIKGVCLPEFMAFNSNKEFVGYFMKQADGIEIKTSIFIPPLLKKKFPHWRRLHLAVVSLSILDTVKKLHEHNIILGDINPNNILIKDELNIYFIDTDSFQIEEYPCSVGMIPYTRIKNHGRKYSEYLRNKNDDIFAIMTLIFQILMPGKLPYSFSGGGSEKENMKPENFSYKFGDNTNYKNAPDGQWMYIWSHLPYKLKEIFWKVFKLDEDINLYEAIKNIKSYIYQLKEGHQTNFIFPSSFKKIDKDKNVINEKTFKYKCISCGSDYFLTYSNKFFLEKQGFDISKRCNKCRKHRNYSNNKKRKHSRLSDDSDIFSFLKSL